MRTQQPKHTPFFANPDRSIWIIIIASTICLAMFIGYLVSLSARLEKIQTEWNQKNDELLTQTLAIEDILSEFGYDGYIHNFKNYVLRRDRSYLVALRKNLVALNENIRRLEATITDIESIQALTSLKQLVSTY